ncbi:MAG: Farnesyl diphosphate synthase [Candidatus Omnitrophica bacterium]|nr:Farnesyl diphosphate synthase [Candidatus Omnitrophota bacterium]
MTVNAAKLLDSRAAQVRAQLERVLPPVSARPRRLHEALRYAALSEGKRVRPALTLLACEAVGGKTLEAMPAALAVELVHTYSLVHDDLPCMDDDTMRRGRPTCHVRYDEGTALLAGDALLTMAFEVLASNGRPSGVRAARRLTAVAWLAEAAGSKGMVGGQADDVEQGGRTPDLPTLESINARKSGKLIAVSCRLGAYLGGGTPAQVEALYAYGRAVGLLFQIVDDILDGDGYAKLLGASQARREAEAVHRRAVGALGKLGRKGLPLARLADLILNRER